MDRSGDINSASVPFFAGVPNCGCRVIGEQTMPPEVVVFVHHYKYSIVYHLQNLPPACLLHGVDDELSPFSQSVELAEEMERRGLAYEFYAYEGLKHYFSTQADDATTQQMFQDSLQCLRRWLEGR